MDVLNGLNERQRQAAADTEGPVLILAGAGSGKTRTLTHRVAHIINQDLAPAERILVVTFTNRAAGELRDRLKGLLGDEMGGIWAMTFHALCLRMLRQSGRVVGVANDFTVLDTADTRKLLLEAARELEDPGGEAPEELRKMQNLISRAKNAGRAPSALTGPLGERTAAVWKLYQRKCSELDALDFDDLLTKARELVHSEHGQTNWATRFRYVMVDEYQDVNHIQESLLQGLCSINQNLCVVGDDSQCLTGEAEISMAEGPAKPIKDVRPGDQVIANQGGALIAAEVTDRLERSARRLIKIKLKSGLELNSTPEHVHLATTLETPVIEQGEYESRVELFAEPQSRLPHFLYTGRGASKGKNGSAISPLRFTSMEALEVGLDLTRPAGRTKAFMKLGDDRLALTAARDIKPGMLMLTEAGVEPVDSVEEVSSPGERVYDLNIEKVHNFYANKICTHNSVYAFRGAEVEHILSFQSRWPDCKIHKLEQNYRSSAAILEAAQAIIDGSRRRSDKVLVPTLPQGPQVRLIRFHYYIDEADFVGDRIRQLLTDGVQPEEIAVAYRTNAQSNAIEEALKQRSIDYQVVGGLSFMKRLEVQNSRAYLTLLANPRDRLALERAISWPRRGVGPATLQQIVESAQGGDLLETASRMAAEGRIKGKAAQGIKDFSAVIEKARQSLGQPLADVMQGILVDSGIVKMLREDKREGLNRLANLDVLQEIAERYEGPAQDTLNDWLAGTALNEVDEETSDGVKLMTLHAAKGLEFRYVFLVGLEEELFMRGGAVDQRQIDEERRLLYVGMTRAKHELIMSMADTRRLWGRDIHTQPLQFLFDLPPGVKKQRAEARQPRRPPRNRRSNNKRQQRRAPAPIAPMQPKPKPSGPGIAVKPGDFPPGTRVSHPTFGGGVVTESSASRIKVRFQGRTRSLVPQYARLTRM